MDPLNSFGPLNPLYLIGATPVDPAAREAARERTQAVGEGIRAVAEVAGGYLLALLGALAAVGAVRAALR